MADRRERYERRLGARERRQQQSRKARRGNTTKLDDGRRWASHLGFGCWRIRTIHDHQQYVRKDPATYRLHASP